MLQSAVFMLPEKGVRSAVIWTVARKFYVWVAATENALPSILY